MKYKDYYKILGIGRKATEEEIRKAFKKKALDFHPDRNPGNPKAEEKFKEINEAKEILLNPEFRKRYDLLGKNWQKFGGGPSGGAPPKDVNDIFSRFFNEVFNRKPKKKIKGHFKISLQEAYNGLHETLRLDDKRVKVRIPPGVKDQQLLRLRMPKAGGDDLFIKIIVLDDPRFSRKGNDLYMEKTVDLYTAVLGKKIEINTLKGKIKVSIPAGTQPGAQLKLKGLGMPLFEQPKIFGNLYLKVNIRLPKRLSAAQRALFEQLDQSAK